MAETRASTLEAAEAALVQGLARKDETSFARLYDLHSPIVYALLLRMLSSDAGAAEETLQEVFWKLWTYPERFDANRGSLRVFLLQQAKSRALDLLRRKRRRNELWQTSAAGLCDELHTDDDKTNPLLNAVSHQEQHRVEMALASLPPSQRRALRLSYFDGLSHREIAEQLGEPLGTVKTRIRIGLRRMRSNLDERQGETAFHEM